MRTIATMLLLSLVACGGSDDDPENRIREWLAAGEAAVESGARRTLVDMISASYADARGNARGDIDRLLRVYFLRQQRIELLTSIDEIRLYGDTAAEVELTVGMAGTDAGLLGISADAYRFELELERDGAEWQLIAARWGELGEQPR